MATIAGSVIRVNIENVGTARIYRFRALQPAAIGLFPPALNSDYANFELEMQAPLGAGVVPVADFFGSYPVALNVGNLVVQQLYIQKRRANMPFSKRQAWW